jgi:hypothetical protein
MFWRWLIWLVFVVAWTWALLLPDPGDLARALILPGTALGDEKESFQQRLLLIIQSEAFSKILHVAAYMVLTILSGWLAKSGIPRWLLLVFLLAHAVATEWLQGFTLTRHPSLRDVGLDYLGIALGLVLAWKWWLTSPVSATAK